MPEKHRIVVGHDDELVAVHHPSPSSDWFVCCHGFISDKSGSYERRCARAVENGYNAVRFDFRGCGESSGVFIEQTLSSRIDDLRTILDYFDPESVVLFGSSFGAKTAFHASVGDTRIEAIVGRAPVTYNRTFDQKRDIVGETGSFEYDTGHTIDHRFFEDFEQYSFDTIAESLTVPVTLFHGRADESVSVTDSLDATAALEPDVLLQVFRDEGHRFSEPAEEQMQHQLFDWLELV